MVWIFASVVLVLLVLVPGFRRFAVRGIALIVALGLIGWVGYAGYAWYEDRFGPKVVIEGKEYREGSSEAYWAGIYERDHKREAAEEASRKERELREAVEAYRIALEQKDRAFDEGAARANASYPPVVAFQKALDVIYERYPFLDSSNPGKNQQAIDEALALTKSWLDRGMPNSNAVLVAAKQVGSKYEANGARR